MKRVAILLALMLVVTLAVAGCGGAPPPPKEYPSGNMAVTAVFGEQFVIALKSIPSTGYRWTAQYDQSIIAQVGQMFTPDSGSPGQPGASGIDRFTFQAIRAGNTRLVMTAKQPWQGGGTGETYTYSVSIR